MLDDLDPDFCVARALIRVMRKLGAPERQVRELMRRRDDPPALQRALEALGADGDLLSVIGAYRGALDDEQTVGLLQDWCEGRLTVVSRQPEPEPTPVAI
jgi:hypothetical protein